ncbi:MAG: MBL fold metallo-hydrolase [Deltaproteobacteria bacterium]|nr:MBL fold metallo-hydrolase [Deltaproteobacteria bacterium]
MEIDTFFDERTWTLTYVVWDEATRDAVIIDPVLDFDPSNGRTWTDSVSEVLAFVKDKDLRVHWLLETHAHADHLSGSQELKNALGAKVGISSGITAVQQVFKGVFDFEGMPTDGSQFDRLLGDGETISAGSLDVKVIHTPGHTPACASFLVDDAVFTGDAIFMPDSGTGRCDFPAGSAEDLYESVHDKLYALPDDTRVFVGHDYQPGGRDLAFETTIAAEKTGNIQLQGDTPRAQFVEFRTKRDAGLNAPKLLFPAVQVNIQAGHLPEPAENGTRYLKIPLA